MTAGVDRKDPIEEIKRRVNTVFKSKKLSWSKTILLIASIALLILS